MRKILCLSVMLMLAGLTSWAQRTVSGRVTDANGAPIAGASVQVQNTQTGTVTKDDGTFSLTIPANARALLVSAVGMVTQEIAVGSQTNLTVSLRAGNEQSMQEVVVVGYGTQRRREITGSVGKIDPRPIATLVTASVDKQLGGRTAGVLVTNPSGLVNEPPRIRVRGVNSINGSSSPLIVLDGIPVPSGGYAGYSNDNLLSTINPADIESIDVLKDGSATAIYGSRASNGVILITTKKGKSGKLNLNYTATFGHSTPRKRFDLLNAQEFVTIANEKLVNASLAPGANMNSENTDTDWQDIVFRDKSRAMSHNFSLDGGTDRSNYFLSLNYTEQQGLIITNGVKRFNIRANLEQRINNWLKLSNYITLARTFDTDQNNGGNALSGGVANALRALPNVRAINPSLPQFDYYNVTTDGAALGSDANTRLIENNYTNIAFVLNKNRFRSTKHRIINNFGLEIKPVSWLTYNFRGSADYITLNEFFNQDARHGDGRSVSGRVQNQAANTTIWVIQNYINANRSFGNHNFFLTLGYENQNQRANSFQAIGTNVADPFYQQNNVISGSYVTQQSSGSYSEGPGFISYFGRLNYDLKGKYFVQATIRRDGLSRFAPQNRFGTFPGVSVGYRISQEDFYASSGLARTINDIKIRASWAKVGNAEIAGGLFPYLNLYSVAPYGAVSGLAASQAGNDNLQWETNEKIDVGIDLSFLNNRITFVADYYQNKNNNLVLAAPQPPSLGVPGNQIFQNIGNMENKGFELSVNADVFRSNNFSWSVGINYTNQRNKVLSLHKNQDVVISNGTGNYNLLRVGQPINAIYGYRFAGVNSSNGNPVYYKADGSLVMGNITNSSYFAVSDVNSSTLGAASSLTGSDRVILGSSIPTYFGGLTSTLNYKGLSLDMLWRFSGGNKIMNITKQESLLNQGFANNGRVILNRWQKPGDVTSVPRLWYNRDNFTNLNQQATDRFVEDGDFVRLDNLQISYNIANRFLNRITNNSVKSFRLYVQAQNLLVFTDYTGIDPDNIDVRGLDYNTLPQPKTFSFGLNIGF